MAEILTGSDMIALRYLSKLDDASNEQVRGSTGDSAGGGYMLGRDVRCYVPYIVNDFAGQFGAANFNTIPNIKIIRINGGYATGFGTVSAESADTVAYTHPGDTIGTAVTIANGEQKLLVSSDPNNSIVVERTTATDLAGRTSFYLRKPYNTPLTGNDFSIGDADNEPMLGLYFPNATDTTFDIKVWLGQFGTAQVSSALPLGSSGSGTISTSGSFADWKQKGFCRIETSGGSLREIVYYYKRTNTTLYVDAFSRGMLGTSAAAGAYTDNIYNVPGCAMVFDTFDGSGEADATPSATNTGITSGTGISTSVDASATDAIVLRLALEAPTAGIGSEDLGCPDNEVKLHLQYDHEGTVYDRELYGLNRIIFDDYEYVLYGDAVADGTPTTELQRYNSLPASYVYSAGANDYVFMLKTTSGIGLYSENKHPLYRLFNASNDDITPEITSPSEPTLTVLPGGKVRVYSEHNTSVDADPADTWEVTYNSKGINPDPDTPGTYDTQTEITMTQTFGGIISRLSTDLGPFPYNADFRVIVRAKRSSDSATSANTTISTVSVTEAEAPIGISNRDVVLAQYAQELDAFLTDATTYTIGSNHGWKFELEPNSAALYAGANLIWRAVYFSDIDSRSYLYFPSTFTLIDGNGTFSPAGGTIDEEYGIYAQSATEAYTNLDYWNTTQNDNNVKIDFTAKTITALNFFAVDTTITQYPYVEGPVAQIADSVLYNLFDTAQSKWVTYLQVEKGVGFRSLLPLNQLLTQAQIEAIL